jgi:hypothetical protein
MAGVFPPGSRRAQAGERGVVGAVEAGASPMGHALVGQHDQPGHSVLNRPKRALVLTPGAQAPGGAVTTGAGAIIGHALAHPVSGSGYSGWPKGRMRGSAGPITTVEQIIVQRANEIEGAESGLRANERKVPASEHAKGCPPISDLILKKPPQFQG